MQALDSAEDTPLLRQYKALKAAYPQAILFFRLGDFYEMFGEDAKLASPILGVVLTKRQDLPMCGVPYHSASHYIAKLLKVGHRIAVADQLEDPAQAKGLVKRAVTRLITPGTIVEDELLDSSKTNYLVALELDTVGWGLACAEVSTGEFWATQALGDPEHLQLQALLARIDPSEVLVEERRLDQSLRHALGPKAAISQPPAIRAAEAPESWPNRNLWQNRHLALAAALKAKQYVLQTQTQLKDLLAPSYRESQDALQLDEAAIRTLELVSSAEGEKKHSLWGVLDKTRTPLGSRKLKTWILHPCLDLGEIQRRLHCVEELLDKQDRRASLGLILDGIADLERIIHRTATRSASPRDLAALRDSLKQLDGLKGWFRGFGLSTQVSALAASLDELEPALKGLRATLESALTDQPPARVWDGGLIREGFDSALDELKRVKTDSRSLLKEIEDNERAATGIPSLRVGYTSVFGYYLEVTKAHQAKVPARYFRKQTLVNAERYITPELKELEVKVLGAEEGYLRLEAQLFDRLREEALAREAFVRHLAVLVAELDVMLSLADAAALNGYVKPTIDLSHSFEVEDGRHPIVENALPPGTFVPNSLSLDAHETQTLILTGPNMGGKSVFLRQNALIAVMAQIGSFVPAKSARIGLVDKILTRIGSKDQLAKGESTFMVEMRETSHILKAATLRSLVLLDEVGRGTSTYDGISIAWAVLEHLNKLGDKLRGPRVLFATHYFELTELAGLLPAVKNANVEAREWTTPEGRTDVVFLHKISPGPADRSFGLHVAELSGIPASCLARAREILHGLENEARALSPAAMKQEEPILPLFEENPVLHELRLLNTNDLTPMAALNKIAQWKNKL